MIVDRFSSGLFYFRASNGKFVEDLLHLDSAIGQGIHPRLYPYSSILTWLIYVLWKKGQMQKI